MDGRQIPLPARPIDLATPEEYLLTLHGTVNNLLTTTHTEEESVFVKVIACTIATMVGVPEAGAILSDYFKASAHYRVLFALLYQGARRGDRLVQRYTLNVIVKQIWKEKLQIAEMLAKRLDRRIGAKIGGRISSRLIPGLGWLSLAQASSIMWEIWARSQEESNLDTGCMSSTLVV